MPTLIEEACDWAASLHLRDIPEDVRTLARTQTISELAALHATRRHPVQARLVRSLRGGGWAEAAALDALMTMALDFDETAFAGHLGHSCALPPLHCAAASGASGERALVAQVAAAEVAARLTAAVTLGAARGQTAAHTHAAGAAIGFGVALGLDAHRLATAFSLALAQPRRVLLPAFMGSDAKFWVAASPILEAARAVHLASEGAHGETALVEAPGGMLDELAEIPLPEALGDYGMRWHLRTLSIKAVPGCAYLTAAVEAAAELGPLDLAEVARAEVGISIFTLGMEAQSRPFVAGPATPLPALGFSTAYNLAAALETGGLDVDDLHGARLESPERWRLAGSTELTHDGELTMAALAATAPVGGALRWAGNRALPWLAGRGAGEDMARQVLAAAMQDDDPGLERPSKCIGARLRVSLRDGRVLESFRPAARGSCQESVDAREALAEQKLRIQMEARGKGPEVEATLRAHRGLAELSPVELRSLVEGR